MLPRVMKLKGIALDLLYPKRCVGCHMEGDFLCPSCLTGIKRLFPPLCPLCGRPQINGVLCQDCVSWNASIDGIRAPFRFEGVIREAIHQFKYKFISAMSSRLAGLMSDYLENYPLNVDAIISVPLHPKRLRERGYNQSALLAGELGKITGLSVIKDSLVRRQYTPPQAKTSSAAERKKNVSGIFDCINSSPEGKNVLLIDDVATTGATLNSCAAALKDSGALSVWGLVLAREI